MLKPTTTEHSKIAQGILDIQSAKDSVKIKKFREVAKKCKGKPFQLAKLVRLLDTINTPKAVKEIAGIYRSELHNLPLKGSSNQRPDLSLDLRRACVDGLIRIDSPIVFSALALGLTRERDRKICEKIKCALCNSGLFFGKSLYILLHAIPRVSDERSIDIFNVLLIKAKMGSEEGKIRETVKAYKRYEPSAEFKKYYSELLSKIDSLISDKYSSDHSLYF